MVKKRLCLKPEPLTRLKTRPGGSKFDTMVDSWLLSNLAQKNKYIFERNKI